MSGTNLVLFHEGQTTIETKDMAGGGVEVHLIGTIDQADPSLFLTPVLERIHADLQAHPGNGAVLDVTQLEFLNSSGLKPVVQWVMQVVALDSATRYRFRIRSSRQVTWQQSALKPIVLFSRGWVTVEEV